MASHGNLAIVMALCLLSQSFSSFGLKDNEHHSPLLRTDSSGVVNDGNKLRFLAIGDWGGMPQYPFYKDAQLETAQGMAHVASAGWSSTTFPKKSANGMPEVDATGEPEEEDGNLHVKQTNNSPAASFVLALGDNFYNSGVEYSNSIRFADTFEKVYYQDELQVPWYICAGNHDYVGDVTMQIEYSKTPGTRWTFPDYNHRIVKEFTVTNDGSSSSTSDIPASATKVKLEILMIDTIKLAGFYTHEGPHVPGYFDPLPGPIDPEDADKVLAWLTDALKKSDADYLIVAGHYPIYSACSHGSTPQLVERLDPLLRRYGVTAYLSGHEHCQFHYHFEGMDYILSGIGDECCYQTSVFSSLPEGGDLKYVLAGAYRWWSPWSVSNADAKGGFASFEAGKDEMTVFLHNEVGGVMYETQLLPRGDEFKRAALMED